MSYIYQRCNVSDFRDAFRACGRGDQFSYAALGALFDYLSEIADGGEPIELDPIAICCEWTEYTSALEAARAYGYDDDDDDASDNERALAWLTDRATVLAFGADTGIVVADF